MSRMSFQLMLVNTASGALNPLGFESYQARSL